MTLGNIVEKLRNRLNDNTTNNIDGEYSNGELVIYINQALSWFCRELKDYKISSSSNITIPAISSGEKEIGKANFNYITNAFLVDSITVNWTENGDVKFALLIKKDRKDIEDLYPVEGHTGDPKYYFEENKKVYIYPIKKNIPYNVVCRFIGIQNLNSLNNVLYITDDLEVPFLDACEYYTRITRPNVSNNLNLAQVLYGNVIRFFNEKGKMI